LDPALALEGLKCLRHEQLPEYASGELRQELKLWSSSYLPMTANGRLFCCGAIMDSLEGTEVSAAVPQVWFSRRGAAKGFCGNGLIEH
jgi:hypothetical protein